VSAVFIFNGVTLISTFFDEQSISARPCVNRHTYLQMYKCAVV